MVRRSSDDYRSQGELVQTDYVYMCVRQEAEEEEATRKETAAPSRDGSGTRAG